MARVLLVLLVIGLVLLGVARIGAGPPESPPAPASAPRLAPRPPLQANPPVPSKTAAGAEFAAGPTPTIDLLVKLEARRRLLRAGAATYLDSMLLTSDSTVRRWSDRPGSPIQVILVPQPAESVPANAIRLITEAIGKWNAVGAGLTLRMTTDSATADVRIRWIDRFDSDRVGQADVRWLGNGSIHSAAVSLARHTKTGEELSDPVLLAVAVHEIGHAVGLPHSAEATDIMFPATKTSNPSRRDQSTIQLLYSLPLGSLR